MKKFILNLLLVFLVIFNINEKITNASTVPPLDAQGVVLMDGVTGEVVYSKNSHVKYEPASTTKVMTALLTLEKCKLDEKVTIGKNPTLVEGTAIGVREGQVYTVKELLLGLLLESGNDCAEALAEHISGSNAAFGELMTKKAHELGAKDTVFKNPSGLHEAGHVTTAYDLSLIMKAAYNNPDFIEISRTPYYIFKTNPNDDGTEKWANNRNHCINENTPYYYKYAFCGKTGYTPEANHTYTAVAKKDNQVLVASFLNAVNKDAQFRSVGELFQYGFDNFETLKIVKKGDVLSDYKINDEITLPLIATEDVYFTKCKFDPAPNISVDYENRDITKEAIAKGDLLFKGSILADNKKVSEMDLASGIDRDYTFKIVVKESFQSLNKNKIALITFSCIALFILILIITLIVMIRRKVKYRRF
ncbi:D-alanyl-D-alanine carboxypeptidase family protein [Clostridium chauvoei]|uniref:serine-type D-Ala-D-Ala carboxypeptidase n=2 Tax=Clostridium chauvoei TaxID=46867 RepID=A0A1U6JNE9_9CLOT|nr:D-alanyl-D-alanine carboxypeptidase family protein [Clostridium chauvoei]ATD55848.1 D-alanyl-D-alanine carboxypeptidase [Clostridium chauvoei]ATD56480.1 D-alanyl-D-alanine carboxypeptidase [Clostridium chauvoei]MBX7280209.1 D-alanyl-D-alanine carboxypeptidase [Clostridium chauvoei]MBX7282681.1 D-alanyl-D-alanine carboxypeptidase [Clostridium chauvoei]MBX7285100.1 D-alanyl-D-alanine carboxypeptidase [Clostridium chauvoei]